MPYNELFDANTRRKANLLETKSKGTGSSSVSWELPRTGLLQQIQLSISASVAGTLSAPNAYGLASIIKRIQVKVNSGIQLFDVSGAALNWLLRDFMYDFRGNFRYNDAMLAVTTGTKNLDVILPISLNDKDQIGLVNLNNNQTLVTLTVEFESDSVVATGATVTCTVTPTLIIFEPPANEAAMPDMNTAVQYIEEQYSISGALDFSHKIARGGVLLGVYYLFPAGYTRVQLKVQGSNVLETFTPETMRLHYNYLTGLDANLSGGAITGYNKRACFNWLGTDGLGSYFSQRDVIDTTNLTEIETILTTVGAGTLTVVRQQIIVLGSGG